jgi:hypothetical protein
VCGVRDARGEWKGLGAEATDHIIARTMRKPCEDLANNTLLTPCLRAACTLPAGFGVAGSVGTGVGSGSRSLGGARAGKRKRTPTPPACLINSGYSSAGISRQRARSASWHAESLGLGGICRPCGQDQAAELLVVLVAQDPQLRNERHPPHRLRNGVVVHVAGNARRGQDTLRQIDWRAIR